MNKGTRWVKRAIALFLVLLFSIESFAAIVSDNDGAAFITKSEFDSLKNNFQAQIDNYNTSIDNKIDGAIAAYLSGLKIDTKSNLNSILNQIVRNGGGMFRALSIKDPEQTNGIDFTAYYEGWIDWSVNTNAKSGWNVGCQQTGKGTVWTYAEHQGSIYIDKYYSNAFIYISGSGTIIVAKNGQMEYANPMAAVPNTLGTSNGYATAFAKNGTAAFANYTLTGKFYSATVMSGYSAPATVAHTKHQLLKESEKMTQQVTEDGTEEKTMTVKQWSRSSYSGGSPGTSATWRKWKWTTKEFYDDELICYPATLAYGGKVLIWEGLPIFSVQQDGEVKFNLKKTGTGAGIIKIKKGKFNNGSLSDEKDIVWTETAPAGAKTYEVTFKVKKDSEYWIKCDNNISVDSEEIVLTSS